METENRRLNTYVKQQLIQLLSQKDIVVVHTGNKDLYSITVKKFEKINGKDVYIEIYKFKHGNNKDSVYVGENCVAAAASETSVDITELKNALFNTIEQQNIARKLEFDRKNMMIYDIRAVEILKRYQRS